MNLRAYLRYGIASALILVVLACAGGVWFNQASTIAPFVLPGASDVMVSSRGPMARRVSYRAAGEAYSWRDAIWRQVVAQGWQGRNYTFGVTRQFAVTWYRRTIELGPLTVVKSAVVGGDPHDPQVVVVEVHTEFHVKELWLP